MRIALLADIHLGNRAMTKTRLRKIVEQVNEARPDLVLIAGDFVTGHGAAGTADRAAGLSEGLSRLHSKFGTIAVLGNHDYWTAPDPVRVALKKAAIAVLENDAIRRGPVAVIGIGDAFSGHDNVARALKGASEIGGVPVVLTHTPDVVQKLPANLPLVLAGHTHCGQVVLPFFGPVLTRSPLQGWKVLYDRRYRCGMVRDRERVVVVTAGLGSGSSPIRLGAPPDWWLLTVGGKATSEGRVQVAKSSAKRRS